MKLVDFHSKYLGVDLENMRSKSNIFKSIVEKVRNKLAGWKAPLLSQTGRTVLVKSVLQSIPIYTLSCYKAHVMIIDELYKIRRDFWWNHKENERKLHLINWNKLWQPIATKLIC